MNKRLLRVSALIMVLSIWGCEKPNELFRAPVVGIEQNNQVPILIKATNIGNVRIEYQKANKLLTNLTDWNKLTDANAFTTNLILRNLHSNSNYRYRVEFENGHYSEWFMFKTFPAAEKSGKFSFVFSACMREKYLGFNIFEKIEQLSPTFVALLGDQMYGDYDGNLNMLEQYLADDSLRKKMIEEGETILSDKTVLQAFRNKYSRVFDENFQKMASRIPLMAIWDDHDYGQDNSDGTYPYKEEAKRVFKESYPVYPFEVENGGIYYKFSIADVDVFVLDARWYRSPMQNEDTVEKKMLGYEQLDWLLNGLKESTSTFKIVFSSTSLNDYGGDTSSGRTGYDSWMDYKFEREKILSFIKDNHIQGVLVFSGDQHYPSAHILNWYPPLKHISQLEKSIEYSLKDLGTSVFDFSASPLNYKRATGHPLIPENQDNHLYSYEIFRADWGMPKNTIEKVPPVNVSVDGLAEIPPVIGSVYGFAEVNTISSPQTLSVKFFELDDETSDMIELYQIKILY
mgnify:FL=1